MDNKEFNQIFETIAKSKTMIPTNALISVLAGIVNSSDKENEDVKKFAEALKDCEITDLVSKTIMFTCNSVIINLWKIFGPQFKEAYNKELEKSAVKEVPEETPKQEA